MKILDLAEFYSERGGGVRSYLDKLLAAAERCGHEVTVLAPGPKDDERRVSGMGRIVRYAAPPMPYDPSYHLPLGLRRMRRMVAEVNPDVLQVSSPFVPAWVAATCKAPLRAHVYHSDPIGSYVSPLAERWLPARWRKAVTAPAWAYMRAVCRRFDVTVVAGHWLERELKQRGCQHVRTAAFGIVRDELSPDRRDPTLRHRLLGSLAQNPDARLVLIAGRLAVDKRQARLVEGLLEANRSRPIGLVLLGDGPERQRLERLGANLPAFEALGFTQNRAEYATLLASVDAVVHGSVSETFGFVLAEALASGTPLLLPDAAGARSFADPLFSESYSAESGPAEIAGAVLRLLAREREPMSLAARTFADTLPSMDQHFDALFSLYADLLVERKRQAL